MDSVYRSGKRLTNSFDLLGSDEPAITDALGWALGNSPALCKKFVSAAMRLDLSLDEAGQVEVRLQGATGGSGFTDIELRHPLFHLIVEAKKGWVLPEAGQLRKYAPRLRGPRPSAFMTISEVDQHFFAKSGLVQALHGTPVSHLTWTDVRQMLISTRGGRPLAERRVLDDLASFLADTTFSRDPRSNMVYVASLNDDRPAWSALPFVDFVRRERVYFHPIGGHYPVQPPTYLGFRYRGALLSIHYVAHVAVYTDLREPIPNLITGEVPHGDHFLYRLGPPILPDHKVSTGALHGAGHAYCMLDALLTSNTVREAVDITKARLAGL